MQNTIRVQDHPLVAVAHRNVLTINEYKYFEEMSYDIDKDWYADGLLCPDSVDLMIANDSFYDGDIDDLPF